MMKRLLLALLVGVLALGALSVVANLYKPLLAEPEARNRVKP